MATSELEPDGDFGATSLPIRRFNWRLSVWGAVGAMVVLSPTILSGNGVGTFLVTLAVVALVALAVLIAAGLKIRRQTLAVLSMLFIFCALSGLLFKTSNELRYECRWLFRSEHYKSLVLAQPVAGSGGIQHMEWDAWGFTGVGDTTVYLVFDPSDSLRKETASRTSGKFSGIPCKVFNIQRLDNHWFSAHFYTDDSWDYCN